MSQENIVSLIAEKFGRYTELLKVDTNYVRFLHFLDCSYDPAEIDVVLYYAFGDYELGIYRSYNIS